MLRSEITGQWNVAHFKPDPDPPYPTQAVVRVADEALRQWLARANIIAPEFLKTLKAHCVVFTAVPSDAGKIYGELLGKQLGVRFISPDVAGLSTIDHIHLDAKSAVAWSNAFLRELDAGGLALHLQGLSLRGGPALSLSLSLSLSLLFGLSAVDRYREAQDHPRQMRASRRFVNQDVGFKGG